MISNQVLSDAIFEIKKLTSFDVCISDEAGTLIEATFTPDEDELKIIIEFALSRQSFLEHDDRCFIRERNPDSTYRFCIMLKGEGKDRATVASMALLQIKSLYNAYDTKTLVGNFINNLLDNKILKSSINDEAKNLGLIPELKRYLFIADIKGERLADINDLWEQEFSKEDFIIPTSDGRVLLLINGVFSQTIEDEARRLSDIFNRKKTAVKRIAFSRCSESLADIPEIYGEIIRAVETAELFYPNERIISYEKLGLGRLINELSPQLCEMFLKENFDENNINLIDDEILNTVNVFFENSLNISETARKLYIHRNTLLYRLNKLQKLVGLDVRNLDDAITFKISVMVQKKYTKEKRN